MENLVVIIVWLGIIAISAFASIRTDSPTVGIVVALFAIGLCSLVIIRRQPR